MLDRLKFVSQELSMNLVGLKPAEKTQNTDGLKSERGGDGRKQSNKNISCTNS